MKHRFSPRRRLRDAFKKGRQKLASKPPAPVDQLRPGARVLAYLSVEGRSVPGVVLEIARRGIWIQLNFFPAPILFPARCVQAI